MAFSSGFFNSNLGDRKYDAIQISSIFEGLILDGIFMHWGQRFRVTPSEVGMSVIVDTGRAWYSGTWIKNDAPHTELIEEGDILLNRIDSLVLDIDIRIATRANTLKYIKGTPASSPVAPTLIEDPEHYQVLICNINVPKGLTKIGAEHITNYVGQGKAQYVTGLLEGFPIDELIAQWGAEWLTWYTETTEEWEEWFLAQQNRISDWQVSADKAVADYNDLIARAEADIAILQKVDFWNFMAWPGLTYKTFPKSEEGVYLTQLVTSGAETLVGEYIEHTVEIEGNKQYVTNIKFYQADGITIKAWYEFNETKINDVWILPVVRKVI